MQVPILDVDETKVLHDAHFFEVKAAIDAKINDLFAGLKNELTNLSQVFANQLPSDALSIAGRTYRGENLGGLPWRALDCPRVFAGEDMLAFRTLLVWGRGFSLHLLLGGCHLRRYAPALSQAHAPLAVAGWRLSVQQSPWDWSLDADSHLALADVSPSEFADRVYHRDWLKLSQAIPLEAFSQIPELGVAAWKSVLAGL
jgi:hypothetical protein